MSYKKWLCIVCDFIYDEAKGIPEEGIPPGTRWQDVPQDWLCPDCGVGKVDFEMVEITTDTDQEPATVNTAAVSLPTLDNSKPPVVIIGSGLAGYQLAREFRKLNATTSLTIITSDDGSLYSKPQLSTGFSKNKKPEQLVTATAETMAQELNANIRVYAEVNDVQPDNNCIIVDGYPLHYSQLVLATGAQCFRLEIAGDAQADIFYVNSLQDYTRFRAALVHKKRVLIIGAGLIGSEYANDLIQSDFDVAVIDQGNRPLGQLLPAQVSLGLQRAMQQAGVEYYQNTSVKSVNRHGGSLIVELADGKRVETDIILSAVGISPRTELATKAGLQVNHGIHTNRMLQTSVANIYALGDCAEVDGHVLCYIAPLMACTKSLAQTLAGVPTSVHYDVMPVTVKTSLYPLLISPPPRHTSGSWTVTAEDNGLSARFCSDDGELLGFVLSGECTSKKHLIPDNISPVMSVS